MYHHQETLQCVQFLATFLRVVSAFWRSCGVSWWTVSWNIDKRITWNVLISGIRMEWNASANTASAITQQSAFPTLFVCSQLHDLGREWVQKAGLDGHGYWLGHYRQGGQSARELRLHFHRSFPLLLPGLCPIYVPLLQRKGCAHGAVTGLLLAVGGFLEKFLGVSNKSVCSLCIVDKNTLT